MGEWHSVNTNKDINNLLEFYHGFHDSCIKEIRYISGAGVNADKSMFFGEAKDRRVEVAFQSQWNPGTIELRFTGMRRMSIIGWQRNYFCDIYGCYLAIHNDLITGLDEKLIVWADNGGFDPKASFEKHTLSEPETSFIIAENLFWREAAEKRF